MLDLDRRALPLTIVNVAYPLAPVGADPVGGAEQVLAALDRALVAAGHRSIVIACAGSKVRGELIVLPAPRDPLTVPVHHAAHEACRAAIAAILAHEPVDVVHLHGVDFHAYLPAPGVPVLATLHLPPSSYPAPSLRPSRPGTFVHCVSHAQARQCPCDLPLLAPIENGVDLIRLRPRSARGDYAVVFARICPEKGQHLALDAAARADLPLLLAGKVFPYPEHQGYHRDEVMPRLDRRRRFLGPVAGVRKAHLLAGARVLVVPSVIEETSSLAAMEALACGTPVVAFRRGALPELIEDGVTGFLVDDVEQLAEAMRGATRLDRARCRAVAEARCSRQRMCGSYLARYRELATTARVDRPTRPRALEVATVDDRGLAALAEPWAALWERCGDATTFQRPPWLLAWCARLNTGTTEAIAVSRGDQLVALLPLFRWHDRGAEVLSLIGAGVSDYLDALVAPEAPGALAALAAALGRARWDRLELGELRDGSPLLTLPLPGVGVVTPQQPCPALDLADGAPLAGLPASLRRALAYQRRRAGRELGVEIGPAAAPADVVGALTRLHGARWAARQQSGVLTPPRAVFLADAVAGLAACDAVLAVAVRFAGELAAIALGFVERGVARYYLGGFEPRHARRGPGTMAIAAAIDDAGRRGARVFDFLRGAEPYKYRFGARDRVWLHRRVVRRAP